MKGKLDAAAIRRAVRQLRGNRRKRPLTRGQLRRALKRRKFRTEEEAVRFCEDAGYYAIVQQPQTKKRAR